MSTCRTIKIVLLGEGDVLQRWCFCFDCQGQSIERCLYCVAGRVGKTSLALRFVHNTFNHSQQATLQASFLSKRLTTEGKEVMDLFLGCCLDEQHNFNPGSLQCRLSLQSGIQLGRSAFTRWVQSIIEMRRLLCLFMISLMRTASLVSKHGCKS